MTSAGWRIERSLPSELDIAIYLSQVIPREGLIEPAEGFRHEAADLLRQVPPEWFQDLRGWTENLATVSEPAAEAAVNSSPQPRTRADFRRRGTVSDMAS